MSTPSLVGSDGTGAGAPTPAGCVPFGDVGVVAESPSHLDRVTAARLRAAWTVAAYRARMTSAALADWQTARLERVKELQDAHSMIGGDGPGRRYRTEQINYALVTRVAFEFQGFARDLHDEAVDHFVVSVASAAANTALMVPLQTMLTQNRALDKRNAQPASIGSDFQRLGMSFWPAMQARFPGSAARWQNACHWLNEGRNGIAHEELAKLQAVAAAGYPVHLLRTAKRFASTMTELCKAMDEVTAQHLQSLLGGPRPW